jgi:phospholipase C
MPFDHMIVVMMENHSFDNLLGALTQAGNGGADGLTFDAEGHATNANADRHGQRVTAFPLGTTAQGRNVTQNWNAVHEQVNGGRMDGFLSTAAAPQPMGYYTADVLPFAYSMARSFCVGNRWFASAPAPTYPNRRFLLAGTAYGDITTDFTSLGAGPPPNGTIFDRLSENGVSWRDYFTDVPMTAVIPSILEKHPGNHAPIAEFFEACRNGTLPAVSFVDPEVGLLSGLGSALESVPLLKTLLEGLGIDLSTIGGDEEDPQDVYFGELWAYNLVNAVLQSPAWPRTLLVYIYDEHGGYYDHVPPPAAIAPDSIVPQLGPNDLPGGYDTYGPRVPAIVVSPYAKAGSATNVVHDHTSVLATIEAKWNLPAMTYRDANAATVMDFLDPANPSLLTPPAIERPVQVARPATAPTASA